MKRVEQESSKSIGISLFVHTHVFQGVGYGYDVIDWLQLYHADL
jgi:hypothetical protein